jgi:AhpD family alkylhydroperoxidase
VVLPGQGKLARGTTRKTRASRHAVFVVGRRTHHRLARAVARSGLGIRAGNATVHVLKPNPEVIMTQRVNPYTVAPDGVAALIGVENYLKECGLDHKLIALVKMRVSQINGCAYCLHMHSTEARKLGETEAWLYLLDAWHESKLYSERERAALAWAEALTHIVASRAPDDVYDAARRQFSEKELADLSIVIAMINAWNRLSIGTRAAHPADRAKAA